MFSAAKVFCGWLNGMIMNSQFGVVLFLALLMMAGAADAQEVIINEVMASNATT